MEPTDEHLLKHFHVAVQAMAASLNSFPLSDESYKQGDFALSLEASNGQKFSARVYCCPNPNDPDGPCIIQFTPCPPIKNQ